MAGGTVDAARMVIARMREYGASRCVALADAVYAEVEKLLAQESSPSRPSPPAEDPA
jgi:hypothetical protein